MSGIFGETVQADERERISKNIKKSHTCDLSSVDLKKYEERKDMIQVDSFTFKLDMDRYINISMDDAKRLYNDLTKYCIFGIKNGGRSGDNDPVGMVNIICDVILSEEQHFEMTIHQLKELYYVLRDMFEKTTTTR